MSGTVITGGTLVDVEGGTARSDVTVVVDGERVSYVGPAAQSPSPTDGTVIDASGRWLIPGLTDMHTHTSAYQYCHTDFYLRYGVTTVRDVGGDITMLRLLRDDIEAGKVIGPRMFITGNIADGNPPVFRAAFMMMADTPDRGGSFVHFMADQGVDAIKVYNFLSEATLARIIETARKRNLPVIGHIPRCITMTRGVEMGMEGLEHIRITAREVLPAAEADQIDYLPFASREPKLWEHIDLDGEAMERLITLLAARPVYLDPTLVVDEALSVFGVASLRTHPNNALLPAALLAELLKEPDAGVFQIPDELKQTAVDGFRKRQRFIGMCHRAGVRLLAGTDAFGLGTLVCGLALHRELELLCESGLLPIDALRAATIMPAQALRRERDLGSIAAGKLADMVILDANPLEDIRHTRRIHKVLKGGQVVAPA